MRTKVRIFLHFDAKERIFSILFTHFRLNLITKDASKLSSETKTSVKIQRQNIKSRKQQTN